MSLSAVGNIGGKIRWPDYEPHVLTCQLVRDRGNDGNCAWRHVGCWLLEIPMAVDRWVDGDLGGRVPDRR